MNPPAPPQLKRLPGKPDFDGIIGARSSDLPADRWSRKLLGGGYSLDVYGDALDIDENRMCLRFPFANGNNRDGVGDVLHVEGIDLSRHRHNPLVAWDHFKQVTLPIGVAEDPETRAYTVELDTVDQVAWATSFMYQGKGLANVERDKEYDHAVFVAQLFDMLAQRFLRGFSVGYTNIDADQIPPDYRTGTPQGLDLRRILMLECSVTSIPANPLTVRKSFSNEDAWNTWREGISSLYGLGRCCGKSLCEPLRQCIGPHCFRPKIMTPVDKDLGSVKDKGFHDLPPPKHKPGDRVETLLGKGTVVRIAGGGKTDHFGISAPKVYVVKMDTGAKFDYGGKEIEFDVYDIDYKSLDKDLKTMSKENCSCGGKCDECKTKQVKTLPGPGFLNTNAVPQPYVPPPKRGAETVRLSVSDRVASNPQNLLVSDEGDALAPQAAAFSWGKVKQLRGKYRKSRKSQPSDKIDPGKARQILKDGEANGKPLTDKQRGMFGAAAGRGKKSTGVRVDQTVTWNGEQWYVLNKDDGADEATIVSKKDPDKSAVVTIRNGQVVGKKAMSALRGGAGAELVGAKAVCPDCKEDPCICMTDKNTSKRMKTKNGLSPLTPVSEVHAAQRRYQSRVREHAAEGAVNAGNLKGLREKYRSKGISQYDWERMGHFERKNALLGADSFLDGREADMLAKLSWEELPHEHKRKLGMRTYPKSFKKSTFPGDADWLKEEGKETEHKCMRCGKSFPGSRRKAWEDDYPDEYQQGVAAGRSGKPQNANPHPDGTGEFFAWEYGWNVGRKGGKSFHTKSAGTVEDWLRRETGETDKQELQFMLQSEDVQINGRAVADLRVIVQDEDVLTIGGRRVKNLRSKSIDAVRFDWPSREPASREDRRIRVRENGSEREITMGELASMVGDGEAWRLMELAVRKGSGRWHPASDVYDPSSPPDIHRYKSKSLPDIRMKYRAVKRYRKTLRRSKPGSASFAIHEKDLAAVRDEAKKCGLKAAWSGGDGGVVKVKLTGDDGMVDGIVRKWARKGRKSLDVQIKGPLGGVSLGRIDELVDHTGKESDRNKWVVFWYRDRYGAGEVLSGIYGNPDAARNALLAEVEGNRPSPLRSIRRNSREQ